MLGLGCVDLTTPPVLSPEAQFEASLPPYEWVAAWVEDVDGRVTDVIVQGRLDSLYVRTVPLRGTPTRTP